MVEAQEEKLTLACNDLSELSQIATQLIEFSPKFRLFLFVGELGSGKTALIREICRQLGVEGEVTSPTFSLINEYVSADGKNLFHFDFYRLNSEWEAANLGLEEYFYSGHYCFIEWPERIPRLVPDRYIKIQIKPAGPESRIFEFEKHE